MKAVKRLTAVGLMVTTLLVQPLVFTWASPQVLAEVVNDTPPHFTGESFTTFAGAQKGLKVGFNAIDFGMITSATVDLYQGNRKLVTNTGTASLYNLINSSQPHVITSFYTQGEMQSEYWSAGQFGWTRGDKPTSAIITVVGTAGTKSITLAPLVETEGATFKDIVIDTVPPSVPTNGTPNGTLSKVSAVTVSWQSSSDDSEEALIYEVQYAKDMTFAQGSINRQGDTTLNMQLSDLSEGVWYWRVRAIDGGGNTSEWSQTWPVTIDTQPAQVRQNFAPGAGATSTLSKVELAPLFFSPPVTTIEPGVANQSVNDVSTGSSASMKAMAAKSSVPQIDIESVSETGDAKLQATQTGWKLFGLGWYWWLLGGSASGIMIRQLWKAKNGVI